MERDIRTGMGVKEAKTGLTVGTVGDAGGDSFTLLVPGGAEILIPISTVLRLENETVIVDRSLTPWAGCEPDSKS